MAAAFNVPNCSLKSSPCLNHSLQLVIKQELFSMANVESLIKKCRKLCTHANHSNVFYSEFYKQQEKQMGISHRLSLIQDIDTRWNSTYYMLQRINYLKPAIASTLLELESDFEFSSAEWTLCDKIVLCLKCFEEATKLLSSQEASISSTIPFVSTIIRALETISEDHGVMRMKNKLKFAMIERFRNIENCEYYSLSCLLDPRYKRHFFIDKLAFQNARSLLITKIDLACESTTTPTNCISDGQLVTATGQHDVPSFANIMEKIIAESQLSQFPITNDDDTFTNSEIIVDKYINSPVVPDCLGFWKNYSVTTNEFEKKLAEQALLYLTPPPTTTDVERLFSTAGDIISDERNRLLPANAEKILFCRENLAKVNFTY